MEEREYSQEILSSKITMGFISEMYMCAFDFRNFITLGHCLEAYLISNIMVVS